jgi:hypothetical protein
MSSAIRAEGEDRQKLRDRGSSQNATTSLSVVPVERIDHAILSLRGKRVILDADLAALYGVPTRRLNEQVRRNGARFPPDFMFQLTREEADSLRSQSAISNIGRGGRRYQPLAFTEHGAIMAASVLNSERAVEVSVFVVRAFVRLREALSATRELAAKLDELERRVGSHDRAIAGLLDAIRQLMGPPKTKGRKPIGFEVREPVA